MKVPARHTPTARRKPGPQSSEPTPTWRLGASSASRRSQRQRRCRTRPAQRPVVAASSLTGAARRSEHSPRAALAPPRARPPACQRRPRGRASPAVARTKKNARPALPRGRGRRVRGGAAEPPPAARGRPPRRVRTRRTDPARTVHPLRRPAVRVEKGRGGWVGRSAARARAMWLARAPAATAPEGARAPRANIPRETATRDATQQNKPRATLHGNARAAWQHACGRAVAECPENENGIQTLIDTADWHWCQPAGAHQTTPTFRRPSGCQPAAAVACRLLEQARCAAPCAKAKLKNTSSLAVCLWPSRCSACVGPHAHGRPAPDCPRRCPRPPRCDAMPAEHA